MGLLKWAIVFLVLALIAALFGYGNVAEGFADLAKVLFAIFVVVMLILFFLGLTAYRTVAGPP
jgi:uncharacterized membrane protein YtjA (UPF0391 family)